MCVLGMVLTLNVEVIFKADVRVCVSYTQLLAMLPVRNSSYTLARYPTAPYSTFTLDKKAEISEKP